MALFAWDREIPAHSTDIGIAVRLKDFSLHRPRQWGACWLACEVYRQLGLDEFWAERLPQQPGPPACCGGIALPPPKFREDAVRPELVQQNTVRMFAIEIYEVFQAPQQLFISFRSQRAFRVGLVEKCPVMDQEQSPLAFPTGGVDSFGDFIGGLHVIDFDINDSDARRDAWINFLEGFEAGCWPVCGRNSFRAWRGRPGHR